MKKLLVICSLAICSAAQAGFYDSTLWKIVKPVDNADAIAAKQLDLWYINEPFNVRHDRARSSFPVRNPRTRDRKAKSTILNWYTHKGYDNYPADQVLTEIQNSWKRIPPVTRCALTFLHRRPYTYGATAMKWATLAAIVFYGAKGIKKLTKKSEKVKTA